MYRSKCCAGISALKNIGLKAEVCRDLQITFCDQFGLPSDLCKLQNRCAIQGNCSFGDGYYDQSLQIPTLYIDNKDMGTLDNLKVEDIKALAQPSPFGLGDKTVYDENVRKASEVKAGRIKLDLHCPREVQNMAPMGHKIDAKLYKLAIYEEDGFFAEHCDTQHAKNHVGTLVVCLPVPHEGGAFILSDDGNELRLPFDELIKDGKIPWVSFYTDVKHKVEVVKSGVQMTLQFDLTVQKIYCDEHEGSLRTKIGDREYSRGLESKYHFQDFNQEILSCIRDRLAAIFLSQTNQTVRESSPDLNSSVSKKEEHYDANPSQTQTIQPIMTNYADSELESTKIQAEFCNDDDDDYYNSYYEEEKDGIGAETKEQSTNPDCIAIMLKRRYGIISLSLDKLKGSDSALYHALKDNFRLEVKHIVLEQTGDYDDGYKGQPIEIIALSDVNECQNTYSSDEEVEVDQENKAVPKKCEKSGKLQNRTAEKGKMSVKKVCLVSGYSSKYINNLVNQDCVEFTGNESRAAVYSYQHAALFVYPKVSL